MINMKYSSIELNDLSDEILKIIFKKLYNCLLIKVCIDNACVLLMIAADKRTTTMKPFLCT